MKYILRRRPSPAFVIACIALFVALGGVSYGLRSGSIDSRELKDNSIRSKDVRNNTLRTNDIRNNQVRGRDIRNSTIRGRDVALNTLTGADVSEKDLGKVPSATRADTATTATNATNAVNAGTVGGMSVRKLFTKRGPGNNPTEAFRGDGFILSVGCAAGGNAILQLNPIGGAPATNVALAIAGQAPVFSAALPASLDLVGAAANATGTVTLSSTGGTVTTIVYAAQGAPAFGGENLCAVSATVTSG